MTYDPPVLLHKATLMQRIADYVRAGYRWHTCGSVSLERASAFVRKFCTLYSIHVGKDERYRRKRAGLGNAVLLFCPSGDAGTLLWWLLVTDGDHPAHRLEKLSEASQARVQCTGYELVALMRPNRARPVLTWRMTKSTYEGWRERVLRGVRSQNDAQLRQAWHSLYRTPGFSGIRSQVGKLVALMRAEWRRTRSGPFPMARTRLGYVQRLKTEARPLSAVLRDASESRQPAV